MEKKKTYVAPLMEKVLMGGTKMLVDSGTGPQLGKKRGRDIEEESTPESSSSIW